MLDHLHEGLRRVMGSTDVFVLAQILTGVSLIIISIHLLAMCTTSMTFNRKRTDKQKQCRQALEAMKDSVANISPTLIQEVYDLKASEIVNKVKQKQLKAEEVLWVYQNKASKAHGLTNCLCEPVPAANEAAASCVSTGGKLCGLPVSLKENIGLQGMDCCAGCARDIDRPFPEDSVIVKVLRHQGAVPFVRTNVPQGLLAWETSNPVFGLTTNPHTPQEPYRTVGGSSGGEAALIAAGGSILGIGSDAGGSLRIPAATCGIPSFKPTSGRISTQGNHPQMKGQTCNPIVYGPLAREVDTLALAMDAMLDPYMWQLDPTVAPLPFNSEVYDERGQLTIGYYDNNEFFETVPAMRRGVQLAKASLEKQGHKLVEWKFKRRNYVKDGHAHFGLACFGDGGQELQEMLKSDKTDAASGRMKLYLSLPKFLLKFVRLILSPFSSFADVAGGIRALIGVGSVGAWWKLNADNQKLRSDMIDEWREFGFDAVLAPGLACPAPTVGTPADSLGPTSYLDTYNLVDFPAGSVPVTKVTQEDEDTMTNTYPTVTSSQRVLKKGLIGSAGLPVNVQVVALPFHDELCLRVMKELESAVSAN